MISDCKLLQAVLIFFSCVSLQHGACSGGSCPPIWGFTPCSSRESWLCFMLLILLSSSQKASLSTCFAFLYFNWVHQARNSAFAWVQVLICRTAIHSALPFGFFVFLTWFLELLPVSWLFRAWDVCILQNLSEWWKSFARLCTHRTELAACWWVSEIMGMISGEMFPLWALCLMNWDHCVKATCENYQPCTGCYGCEQIWNALSRISLAAL